MPILPLGCVCTLGHLDLLQKNVISKRAVWASSPNCQRCIWVFLCALRGIVSLIFAGQTHLAPEDKCTHCLFGALP